MNTLKEYSKILQINTLRKKKKIIRENSKPYVTIAMRKAIMKGSEQATKFRNRPTDDTKKAFKKTFAIVLTKTRDESTMKNQIYER